MSIHDSLAVFTAILIARYCFSLQDLVVHVVLPSLLMARPTGKLEWGHDRFVEGLSLDILKCSHTCISIVLYFFLPHYLLTLSVVAHYVLDFQMVVEVLCWKIHLCIIIYTIVDGLIFCGVPLFVVFVEVPSTNSSVNKIAIFLYEF